MTPIDEATGRLEEWVERQEIPRRRPSIAELEAILDAPGPQQVSITPAGEITVGDFAADLRLVLSDRTRLLAELAEFKRRSSQELTKIRQERDKAFLEVAAIKTENERLHTRLEDDRVWTVDVISGERTLERVVLGSIADGIECRDDTIRLLEDELTRLLAELAWVKAELSQVKEDFAHINATNWRDAKAEAALAALKARALEVVRPFAGISTLADADCAAAFVRELEGETDAD